jgi:hypothetical protein
MFLQEPLLFRDDPISHLVCHLLPTYTRGSAATIPT